MFTGTIIEELKNIIDNKTKPPGSLGLLENTALKIGLIQKTNAPIINAPHIVVFAADHGIAAAGVVNNYPQEVTAQMVLNFIKGGAAINVFCRQHNIGLVVVDAGVNADLTKLYCKTFINAKIGMGTKDYRSESAMTEQQALDAIDRGKNIVSNIAVHEQSNCIGFGEMGISNTSSASLIMSAVLNLPIQSCVGRGTGASDEQLSRKTQILQQVFDWHRLDSCRKNSIEVLKKVGGFEMAEMVGAYIQAYDESMIIVVDGFIATAALLLALLIKPCIIDNCVFAHRSNENGHAMLLDYLNAKPLLDLGLRLGEGTGAALAIPLIQSAVNFLNEMESFQTAAVTNATR